MRSRRPALAAILVAVMMVAQPATARDPDASDQPRTSGPLVGLPFECADNGPPARNEVKGQVCSWMYELVPAETDTDEDFSVYWVQSEIHPGDDWCAYEIEFDVRLPKNMRIVSAALEEAQAVTRDRDPIVRLEADGGGSAPVPGIVEQTTMIANGAEHVSMSERTYAYRWTGRSSGKVVVAIGLELAHAVPLDLFTSWSEGHGASMGSCRPIVIRIRPR